MGIQISFQSDTHAQKTVLAQCQPLFDHTGTSNEATSTHAHIAIEDGPGRDVAVVANRHVVFHQSLTVDYAIHSDTCTRIHDRAVKNHSSIPDAGMA